MFRNVSSTTSNLLNPFFTDSRGEITMAMGGGQEMQRQQEEHQFDDEDIYSWCSQIPLSDPCLNPEEVTRPCLNPQGSEARRLALFYIFSAPQLSLYISTLPPRHPSTPL